MADYRDDVPWTDIEIETERLRLRAFDDRDRDAVMTMAASPEVRRFLGGPLDQDALDTIALAPMGERSDVFCIADSASDQAIGRVSLGFDRGEAEVSYELLAESWGHGFGAEAVAAFLQWVRSTREPSSIIAVTQSKNERSCRMLEQLGFVEEQRFEEWGAQQTQYRLITSSDG